MYPYVSDHTLSLNMKLFLKSKFLKYDYVSITHPYYTILNCSILMFDDIDCLCQCLILIKQETTQRTKIVSSCLKVKNILSNWQCPQFFQKRCLLLYVLRTKEGCNWGQHKYVVSLSSFPDLMWSACHKKRYLLCVELTNFGIFTKPFPIFFQNKQNWDSHTGQRQLISDF